MISADLVVEDPLSEAVMRKVIARANARLDIRSARMSGGFGQIRKNIRAYNKAAAFHPFVILTDLDRAECPATLIREWLGDEEKHERLIFRVAEKEVESWLMADRERFAALVGIQVNLVPGYPDQLADPKMTLLNLVSRSSNGKLKKAILPKGPGSSIGPGYNDILAGFATQQWRPDAASRNSSSLKRAIHAIKGLA